MASSFLSPEAQEAALLGICFILHVPKRRFVSACPCRPLLASSQASLTQSWPPGSSLVVKGLTGDLEGEGTGLCLVACQTLFRT